MSKSTFYLDHESTEQSIRQGKGEEHGIRQDRIDNGRQDL